MMYDDDGYGARRRTMTAHDDAAAILTINTATANGTANKYGILTNDGDERHGSDGTRVPGAARTGVRRQQMLK